MAIYANFRKRNGAGCSYPVKTAEEAEKILKGGYTAQEVVIVIYPEGTVIGRRWRATGEQDDKRLRWLWFYDRDYFEGGKHG